ncbi:hypothetical protein GLOIN_2v1789555 [Rhizophagus irregularis DAOM 181602=DAOM 197198]|uniref:Uncharacterized protein n=1 Tax=Rhizophagus irregularis (strain DAOM 181602 / DAOM 197198 / MUCL 43194) TaxID=747089 RepID=A0A2P4P151_RHIID|nr:hypothetical protein GLOIN_2v1789555 [Rhizophagus irregularis DAOM 181602=DAOM 197198]POG59094.1 hypothetical protein GLOIN_2v1789555 [Rhizophagus irregularis DAOM 181602=DAOM 197198]GET66782.1 hypothetical protein GLOIN_2v1789555 [Rhizophagus irregularis DAOM 181602=DAOM 197198]|eukprot:XP_025165960.1 hypothetical protein GLOIN_2v1789555 [Rhizophagus irregularis DAOM 181602=DAOM 197198]
MTITNDKYFNNLGLLRGSYMITILGAFCGRLANYLCLIGWYICISRRKIRIMDYRGIYLLFHDTYQSLTVNAVTPANKTPEIK